MTDQTEKVWRHDFANVHALLAPWAVESLEGPYVGPGAPEALQRLYGALTSIGYAKGWL